MMAGKSKIEELSVVADPWNLKLKPANLKVAPFPISNCCYTVATIELLTFLGNSAA
jgi:hypothetical protein